MMDLNEVKEWYEGFVDGDGDSMEALLMVIPSMIEEIETLRENEITVEFTSHEPTDGPIVFPGEFLSPYHISNTHRYYTLVLKQRNMVYNFRALAVEGVTHEIRKGGF